MANQADAEIVMKLYDMRREPVMREARNWYLNFWPKTAQDVIAVAYAFGTKENAYMRQVGSYWDMAASLVLRGAVDPELFMDWAGEMVFVYAKYYPILKEVREAMQIPTLFAKVEEVIAKTGRQQMVEMMVERQKAMQERMKQSASAK